MTTTTWKIGESLTVRDEKRVTIKNEMGDLVAIAFDDKVGNLIEAAPTMLTAVRQCVTLLRQNNVGVPSSAALVLAKSTGRI